MEEAYASLDRTPDLLPVLKDAGVVDSGAAGFIKVVEGMQKAINGEILEKIDPEKVQTATVHRGSFNAHSELTFGYCTEFILQLQHSKVDIAKFDEKVIIEQLEVLGDSIVCIKDEDIVKVHVHTKTPGVVLGIGQKYGEFLTLKIENMSVQHTEANQPEEPCDCEQCVEMRASLEKKKVALVAVASGEGLVNLFKSMGVDYVVSGGQTMNPAAEDFVKAFDSLNAENILVFPNNGNIVMAAKQAGKYYDKANVVVIKTKSDLQNKVNKTFENEISISTVSGDGIEELKNKILELAHLSNIPADSIIITNERHKDALTRALKNINSAIKNIEIQSLDLVSISIKQAYIDVGEITGNTTSEDIIDQIFKKFCLGK
jgi:dihydroxyacetone kinase-like predicted kinase